MIIVYAHGLDSSAHSVKGVLLEEYCKQYHQDIKVIRPDLNKSPEQVLKHLCSYVEQARADNEKVVIMGSSLGGYFSTLVSNKMECPAFLLNPSTQPHISLQRFVDDNTNLNAAQLPDTIIYNTTGGWDITLKDLSWFNNHKLQNINNPKQVYALIKQGDELLDPTISVEFYRSQGAHVNLQPGGDHRMTDFDQQLTFIVSEVLKLVD